MLEHFKIKIIKMFAHLFCLPFRICNLLGLVALNLETATIACSTQIAIINKFKSIAFIANYSEQRTKNKAPKMRHDLANELQRTLVVALLVVVSAVVVVAALVVAAGIVVA